LANYRASFRRLGKADSTHGNFLAPKQTKKTNKSKNQKNRFQRTQSRTSTETRALPTRYSTYVFCTVQVCLRDIHISNIRQILRRESKKKCDTGSRAIYPPSDYAAVAPWVCRSTLEGVKPLGVACAELAQWGRPWCSYRTLLGCGERKAAPHKKLSLSLSRSTLLSSLAPVLTHKPTHRL
jgi:hypothetical protein